MNGSIVALITPFNDLDQIDYTELERLCEYHIENKTDGLLLLGTTAEAEALSYDEKRELVDFVCKKVENKLSVMVGIISNITEEVIEQAKLFDDIKFDSYLVINPFYNKTNESGMLKHFTYIADSVGKPVVLYNVPKRTGMSIPIEVVRALSYHKNIIGIKEASGDMNYLTQLFNNISEDFTVYCGDDSTMLLALYLGAKGVISVIGNAFPKEIKLITSSFNKNDGICKTTFYKLYDLIRVMYEEVSPIGIKYIMYLIGFNKSKYRRPLDEPSRKLKRSIEKELFVILDEN